ASCKRTGGGSHPSRFGRCVRLPGCSAPARRKRPHRDGTVWNRQSGRGQQEWIFRYRRVQGSRSGSSSSLRLEAFSILSLQKKAGGRPSREPTQKRKISTQMEGNTLQSGAL